ncbi:MAG TPA: carboxypeptidase-like regulatory domain-containing protein [Gemmataceae bacterium]|jgi:hypothetical protein|nr:carboxypeptidase-like regulatory domain-containing protein [Gemmataceae bacterium]
MLGSYRSTRRSKNRLDRRLNVETLETRDTPTASAISASFNGTKINAGSTIWFSAVAKFSGLGTAPTMVHMNNSAIDFTVGTTKYHVIVPNEDLQITPGATSASIVFDGTDNDWDNSVPKSNTGDVFMTGVGLPVTTNLPGGIKNVTWQANFWSDTTGVTVSWQWGAAVYKSFDTDYNNINVKPVDSNTLSAYKNKDLAGTPEAFKSQTTGGGTGSGGTNYTGNFTAYKSVKASFGDGMSDYPFPSDNPRTSIAFNESTVLRAANLDLVNGQFEVWYNDEHALALGVGTVNVTTSTGTATTSYPIAPLTSNPGVAINPAMGSTATDGDQAGTDVSSRPLSPSLFITDITNNPNDRSGDWQYGGTAIAPSAVFGTWKSFTRNVNKTTGVVTVDTGTDPAKNNWNLGTGSDAQPGVLSNEGYGAEIRWSLTDLQSRGVLIPGHNYRFYVMVHDGDQNKSGGDAGQASYQYYYPGTTGGTATLSGTVVVDTGDRNIGPEDVPAVGITVQLVDGMGNVFTQVTDSNGAFSFSVPAGTYTLQMDLSNKPTFVDMFPVIGTESGIAGDPPDGSLNTTTSGAHTVANITLVANDTAAGYILGIYDTATDG